MRVDILLVKYILHYKVSFCYYINYVISGIEIRNW